MPAAKTLVLDECYWTEWQLQVAREHPEIAAALQAHAQFDEQGQGEIMLALANGVSGLQLV